MDRFCFLFVGVFFPLFNPLQFSYHTLPQQDNPQVASVKILLQHKSKKSNKQHERKFQRNY